MSKLSKLNRTLPVIAAMQLHISDVGVPRHFWERMALAEAAYGCAEVEVDFAEWCESVKGVPRYPISEYLKVVDERLGAAPARPQTSPEQAVRIQSHCYTTAHQIPNAKNVQTLLADYSEAEIISGFDDYFKTRQRDQIPRAVKAFFVDGEARIVLSVQREAAEPMSFAVDTCEPKETPQHSVTAIRGEEEYNVPFLGTTGGAT